MFKIVASFTRPNADHEFFSDIYMKYDLIKNLHLNAAKNPGFLGIDENVYRDEFRCDKALCFDSQESFLKFAAENQDILDRRKKLIDLYCAETKHEYKYYVIVD